MSIAFSLASAACSAHYVTGLDPAGWWLLAAVVLLWRAIRTA